MIIMISELILRLEWSKVQEKYSNSSKIVQDPVRTPEIPPKISNLDECASHRYEELKQMMNKMRKESKRVKEENNMRGLKMGLNWVDLLMSRRQIERMFEELWGIMAFWEDCSFYTFDWIWAFLDLWIFRWIHTRILWFRCPQLDFLSSRCLHTILLGFRCLHTWIVRFRCLHTINFEVQAPSHSILEVKVPSHLNFEVQSSSPYKF